MFELAMIFGVVFLGMAVMGVLELVVGILIYGDSYVKE